MKRLFRLSPFVSALALLSLFVQPACAQKHVAKIIDAYAHEKKIVVQRDLLEERKPHDGQLKLRRNFYSFELTWKEARRLQKIIDAFDKDAPNAYWTFSQNGNTNKPQAHTLVYGTDEKSVVKIGQEKGMNYIAMTFRDKKNTNFRSAYVLCWRRLSQERSSRRPEDICYEVQLMDIYGAPATLAVSRPKEVQTNDIHAAFDKYCKEKTTFYNPGNAKRKEFLLVFKRMCDLYTDQDANYDGGVAEEICKRVQKDAKSLDAEDLMMCRLKLEAMLSSAQKKKSYPAVNWLTSAINRLRIAAN